MQSDVYCVTDGLKLHIERSVVDSAFSKGQFRFPIKSSQDSLSASNSNAAIYSQLRQAIAVRQVSEWGMRARQRTFSRLKDRFIYEEEGERKVMRHRLTVETNELALERVKRAVYFSKPLLVPFLDLLLFILSHRQVLLQQLKEAERFTLTKSISPTWPFAVCTPAHVARIPRDNRLFLQYEFPFALARELIGPLSVWCVSLTGRDQGAKVGGWKPRAWLCARWGGH
eukprot:IDg15713t1